MIISMKRLMLPVAILIGVQIGSAVVITDEYIQESKKDLQVDKEVVYELISAGESRYFIEIIGVTTGFDVEELNMPETYLSPNYVVSYAFEDCNSLKSVKLSSPLNYVSSYMFKNCKNLQSVDMKSLSTCIGFYSVIIYEGAFYGCIALRDVKLPGAFEGIGKYAFQDCISLERVDIVGEPLHSYFPDDDVKYGVVKLIGDKAFGGCTGLKRTDVPKYLNELGDDVWTDCVNLEEIYYMADEPLEVDESKGVFSATTYANATLYLSQAYAEKRDDWREGLVYPWNRFQHIEIMDTTGVEDIESDSVECEGSGDIDESHPYEIYTISGVKLMDCHSEADRSSLSKGFYILKQDTRTKKVLIP